MPFYKSVASGNLTDASTWALCVGAQTAEAGSTNLGATYQGSGSYNPGSPVDIQGVCVKVALRNTTVGTISVEIYDQTAAAQVAGTEVTIDVADLAPGDAAGKQSYWHYFKFAAPVTLAASTNYTIRAKVSSSTSVSLFRNSSLDWDKLYVTTTNQDPATTNGELVVVGDKTGPGTSNSYTITMDSTVATDYGSGSTANIFFGHDATFEYTTAPATNSVFRTSSVMAVGSGATFNIGTIANPIPADSTAVLEFDCATDGQIGLEIRGGTCNFQGVPRTVGKNVDRCLLAADATAGATVLTVSEDTGWLPGDVIVIASTSNTATQREERTIASVTSSTITITAGLTHAHEGNSDVAAEIILLNRNIMIRSVSSTAMTYVYADATSTVDWDWVDFRYVGQNALPKYGVTFATTTGSANVNNCIVRNSENRGFNIQNSLVDNVYITDCTAYISTASGNVALFHIGAGITGANVVFNNCWAIGAAGYGVFNNSPQATMTNMRALSGASGGYILNTSYTLPLGVNTDWILRSNTSSGLVCASNAPFVLDNFQVRRNNLYGLNLAGTLTGSLINSQITGNLNSNILTAGRSDFVIKDSVVGGETGYASPRGINLGTSAGTLTIDNCSIGKNAGNIKAHTTSTILSGTGASMDIIFNNMLTDDSVEVASQTTIVGDNYYSFINKNAVDGDVKAYVENGSIVRDTTTYGSISLSQRLTPISLVGKLESSKFYIPVNSGQAATVSVEARKSLIGDGTAYNGSQPRLIIKANAALGYDTDVVLDTATSAADGNWETLTGTAAAASSRGVIAVVVDCDGSTGWANVANWSTDVVNDTNPQDYWFNGRPLVYADNTSGGGGGSATVGYAFAG